MNKNELIAQYLINKLSESEKKEFDLLMVTDSEFSEEVSFQENLKTAIGFEERIKLKRQLQDFEKDEKHTVNYNKWYIAASIVLLLGVSSFWFLSTSINAEKLFVENFEPYRNVVQPIVRSDSKMDLKTKAFTAYETGSYDMALMHFNELLKEKNEEIILFYKANVLLKIDKTSEAITVLEQNLKTSDSLDDKNSWYLALANLKMKNIDEAKDILIQLEKSSSFKKESVTRLLSNLK